MTVKKGAEGNGTQAFPTVADAQLHAITALANKFWAPHNKEKHSPFNSALVNKIYATEIKEHEYKGKGIALLEYSHYLEYYLWPNFTPEASYLYYLSIVIMVNEKFKERTEAWTVFIENPKLFPDLIKGILKIALFDKNKQETTTVGFLKGADVNIIEKCAILTFLQNCFNSVEVDIVRNQMAKLISMHSWANLLPSQREEIFNRAKKLRKYWNTKIEPELGKEEDPESSKFERTFLWSLINQFKDILSRIDKCLESGEDEFSDDDIHYCEKSIALFIDLEALLPTRRFFNAIIHASNVLVHCTLSVLITTEMGTLFCQLVEMLKFYIRYDIDDISGQPLNRKEVAERHHKHVTKLQRAAFQYFKDSMSDFALLNVGNVDSRSALKRQFDKMSKEELYRFAESSNLVAPRDDHPNLFEGYTKEFLTEALILHCERRIDLLQYLNNDALFPTEKVIWNRNIVPNDHVSQDNVLALDKLNLQFLTIRDYLMRNFKLFQMESTHEIRQDLEDVLIRLRPWRHESRNETIFGGWARMALALNSFEIIAVDKPFVGQTSPSCVKANFTVNVGKRHDIRTEWESLRKHDVCFLICVRATANVGAKYDPRKPLEEQMEIAYVRGCEIEGMLDPTGKVIEEYASYERKQTYHGETRTFRVLLDTNQYRMDMENHTDKGGEDVYTTFNLVMRRDPKTNNFKAVLGTIRELLNTECVIPEWLQDVVIGFGNPAAAHYTKLNNRIPTSDFNDTFLSYDHLVESFPEYKVESKFAPEDMIPPFKLTFKDLENQTNGEKVIVADMVKPIPRSPYPLVLNRNQVKFTPSQVEAVKAGMQPGLTMIVGPPGTGKTDVAVQIISNIYHNWPNQRTLVVTHSNQALNQLFEKIIALDVDERHLLRMGHGEESLETEKDFSRYGRVNYVLKERLRLLQEVEKLQKALEKEGDVSYSCDNAGSFFRFTVQFMWDKFLEESKQKNANIESIFPFRNYFTDLPEMFSGNYEKDIESAQSGWRHIKNIFEQLEEFRAFELLRNGRDRTEYLLVKEAKIIAMTCTHAALRRKELVDLGFRYDNILMEEAAQILEVETFIPLLLQNPKDGRSRLKRWIMIGDHNQLPPIVQNRAFQKYSNMEQSLFARFVRLGVPHTMLDSQGRARADIASLYSWRYRSLGNLPHIESQERFQNANAGFGFSFQLIDVPDFNGVGESEPSQFFYQNLGEAEYAVALFTYMRILGYPAEKISIITTYNGQAQLIRDVIESRCAKNPLIGSPHKISTVDKYQGQQNDFIILSLVRTKHIGHIRDVRRLIVALSRARLGLYILGRASLFRNCLELQPSLDILCKRPPKLIIIPSEPYPATRKIKERAAGEPLEIQDTIEMCHFVHEFYMSNVETMKLRYQQAVAEYEEKMAKLRPPAEETKPDEVEVMEEEEEEEPVVPVKQADKKEEEPAQDIVFEEMDFERLEEVPRY